MSGGWGEYLSAWDEWRVQAEGYRQLDEERVLVLGRFTGLGKRSGLQLGQVWAKGASPFQVRDGKVIELVIYWDRERAFADLGISQARQPTQQRRGQRARASPTPRDRHRGGT